MIIDKLEHIMMYAPLVCNLAEGMEAFRGLKDYKTGRYEFPGGYFMIQRGETKPMAEGTFEAHRKYVDVQIILDGCEEVAWEESSALRTVVPYAAEKDTERLEGEVLHHILIGEGMFYMAFPHDGHKPVSHTVKKHSFTKLVMKLKPCSLEARG